MTPKLGKINDNHNSPVDLGVPCFQTNKPTSIYKVVFPLKKLVGGFNPSEN
jgi:hypothetical protein